MVIELAMAGMLQCFIAHKQIVEDDINCFYQCVDTTKEFASTLIQEAEKNHDATAEVVPEASGD